jgi:nicotinate-nucleotide pyrophosphorylase
MESSPFSVFFTGVARERLVDAIRAALTEDGRDLTTNAVFRPEAGLSAHIVAKQGSLVCGLPILPIILAETALLEPGAWNLAPHCPEGAGVGRGQKIASFQGSARILLRAERVMLNFLCHLSGIANTTAQYVAALEGTGVRLLDTRKTLPGLRYPEKYAVTVGGGVNHRKNLEEMLMLKDNHIDAAGSIAVAVGMLAAHCPGIPVEVECSTLAQVKEAMEAGVARIMLDNMDETALAGALPHIPPEFEVEVSGNVTLENIRSRALACEMRKPDFISVGRLTHSAPYADFSMRIEQA